MGGWALDEEAEGESELLELERESEDDVVELELLV